MKHRLSAVYFITSSWLSWCTARPVKVGHSVDVQRRLRSLQSGNHLKLYVYATIPRARPAELEAIIHTELAPLRIGRSEWFNLTTDDIRRVLKKYDGAVWLYGPAAANHISARPHQTRASASSSSLLKW